MSNTPNTTRMEYLDGLRGVAALAVLNLHFLSVFFPQIVPGWGATRLGVADTPLGILFNGKFAVSVFFVMSGFVVSKSALGGRHPLIISTILRYLRLALPASMSVILSWALLHVAGGALTEHRDLFSPRLYWFSYTQQNAPPFSQIPYEAFIRTFFIERTPFNNVLWTMKFELIASVFLYAIYSVQAPKFRYTILFAFGLASIALRHPLYLPFALGAALQELWTAGYLKPIPRRAAVIGLAAVVFFGAQMEGFHERLGLPPIFHLLELGAQDGLISTFAAALLVYLSIASADIQKPLTSRTAQFFGKVSFSLYLVHQPMLITMFISIFVFFSPMNPVGIFALFCGFFAASAMLGWIVTIGIDEPVLKVLARLRRSYPQLLGRARPQWLYGLLHLGQRRNFRAPLTENA